MTQIAVLVADDDRVIRDVLVDIVNAQPDCTIVATAVDAVEAVERAEETQPNVAIIDVRMPKGGGEYATAGIVERSPRTHVLAFSAHGDRETVLRLLHAGACGYIIKGASPNEVMAAVRRAAAGQTTLDPEIAADFVTLMNQQQDRRNMETGVREARVHRVGNVMKEHLLDVALQPIVRLVGRDVVGLEALARIRASPTRAPDYWFAEAESVGMLLELELFAIEAALQRLQAVPEDAYLAINVSPSTVLTRELERVIPPGSLHRIVLELTEHAPVVDYEELHAALTPLRSRGMRVAIDDAGAGFASLRHIIKLSPEIIKLDRSLVEGIETHRSQRAVAAGLISAAAQIGAVIVAEGIETEVELDALIALGVDVGQGYLLGRPTIDVPVGFRVSASRF